MYTIDQVSLMTGLTTRTLRNYIKADILHGDKVDGVWQFTEQQITKFVYHPSVCSSIQAKHNAVVYDFLSGQNHGENEICFLLDRTLEKNEAAKLADFFCNAVNGLSHIRFAFSYKSGKAHYILKGAEADISQIMKQYYGG